LLRSFQFGGYQGQLPNWTSQRRDGLHRSPNILVTEIEIPPPRTWGGHTTGNGILGAPTLADIDVCNEAPIYGWEFLFFGPMNGQRLMVFGVLARTGQARNSSICAVCGIIRDGAQRLPFV